LLWISDGGTLTQLCRPSSIVLAEGVGFEPTKRWLNVQRFSRSTGVPPLTCLLATVWTGQGTARAPAAGLLDEHVGHCVANAAAAGDQNKAHDMVTEATQAIARVIKT